MLTIDSPLKLSVMSVLQKEVGQRLLDRLEFIQFQPDTILEWSAEAGFVDQAGAPRLPDAVADRSISLIMSNLVLYRYLDAQQLFAAFKRILRPGGLLLFSTLGPDTSIDMGPDSTLV